MHTVSNRLLWYCFCAVLAFSSCTEKDDPFPSSGPPEGSQGTAAVPNPNSIVGIHQNIFKPKCAIPSCHGGTFEPDFRTVESTYHTLIYQPVTKNTIDEKYKYRVVPGDTLRSWLFHRVTVEDTLIPRMPIYMDGLTAAEVGNIRSWIMAGAPDARGVLPVKVNLPPTVHGYGAYNSSFQRIDQARPSWSEPFPAPLNQTLHFWVFMSDPETQTKNLGLHKMKFSLDPNDFSNAVTVTAVYTNGPVLWGWVATVNTSQFPAGSTVYMRYQVKDPVTSVIVESPNDHSYSWFKTNFSFTL